MDFGWALGHVGGAERSEGSDWRNSFVTERGRGQDGDMEVRLFRVCQSQILIKDPDTL